MFQPFLRAGRLLPACVFAFVLLVPAFAAEDPAGGQEDFYKDDPPLMEEDEGITVTGTPETTQQMTVITREEIERFHAPDLASLLQDALGLGFTRYGPYGNRTEVNIRGFDTERIAVLINGTPVNSPLSGDFDFSMIDLNAVERIEVVYGGSDSKYNVSGALGGVINIITVKKQEPGLRIGGGVSNTSALPGKYYKRDNSPGSPRWQDLFDTQNLNLSAGLGREKFSWSANWFGNRAANHFLLKDYYNVVRRKENNEVWDTGASTSFVWDLPEYAKLILAGDLYYGGRHIPRNELSRITGTEKDFSLRQNIMLDMPRIFRDDLAAEASVGYGWQNLDYTAPDEDSLHRTHTVTAINRWTWYSLEKFTLMAGGDYRFTYLDSTDTGIKHGHDGGVYLTAEYALHRKFLVVPSVKMAFRGGGDFYAVPVPKLGLLWNAAGPLTLKNNYYRSFKFPDFEDLYWHSAGYSGNPSLRPEDGWGADLGAEYRPKSRVLLEGSLFVQWIEDSIHWSNSGGTWRPENVAEAVFFGGDARLRIEIPVPLGPVKKIIPSLSYQYMLSYILTGRNGEDIGFSAGIRIPYMPIHSLGASLEIPWKTGSRRAEGSLTIAGRYESPRYTSYTVTPAAVMNTGELDPVFLLNVNVNQRIGARLAAFAVLRNILNRPYVSMADYHMPGLTVTLGMKAFLERGIITAKP
jgi:vitamin B12 transporter